MSTTFSLNKINLLNRTQYDSIENPSNNELYAVKVNDDTNFHSLVRTLNTPDYVNGLLISATNFTAPVDGVIVQNSGAANTNVTVNGVTVATSSAVYTVMIPVAKDDYITVGNATNFVFYPYRTTSS